MMIKHDKDICHIRANNLFKSIIRSGFYPRKDDKTIKPDRIKYCVKQGEFNPDQKEGSIFDDKYKYEPVNTQKQERLKITSYNKNLRSSIDMNHPNSDNNKYHKKNEEYYPVNKLITKEDLHLTNKTNNTSHNPVKTETNISSINNNIYNNNNVNFNNYTSHKHKSKSTNFNNNYNPITNPNSETNIFKKTSGNEHIHVNNKTYITSKSNILNPENKKVVDRSFKQFSMGKITTQAVNVVAEKTKAIDIPKPITSFAHYRDYNSPHTYYKN